MVKLYVPLVALLCVAVGTAQGPTRREIFGNSAVHLSATCIDSTGSGFIFFRPEDPSNQSKPPFSVFLVTNRHVLPPEGRECKLAMRASIAVDGAPALKVIDIPVVGTDGKYLDSVKRHQENDIAAIRITAEMVEHRIGQLFVPTALLGTKERLRKRNAALVGDEIYALGYPAGLFDKRNAFPIWRIGIIATSPLLGYAFPDDLQKTFKLPSLLDGFLIDAQIYPGSSGSAVVVKPSTTSFDNPSHIVAGGARTIPYVLGLVSGSIPILDFGPRRVLSRMGLGVVESADAINDTIEAFYKK
jgi:S1-C subfamily serine protease